MAVILVLQATSALAQVVGDNPPEPPVRPTVLRSLQDRQKEAIEAVRFSVVSVKAFNSMVRGAQNIGAGAIVSDRCHVVTNSHVVADFDTVEVSFSEGGWSGTFKASVLANDAKQDLALLQFSKGAPCVPVSMPQTVAVEIGETVFVIGSPFALQHTVTKGIVSKVKRDLSVDGMNYPDMIQTDASINQGNSGGPMINLDGALVGIATAIFSKTGSSAGLGFAIPVERVKAFIDQEMTPAPAGRQVAAAKLDMINLNEKVPHGFLGRCLDCHAIQAKTPITLKEPVPHPSMGACTDCHDIVQKKPGHALTVALTRGYLKNQIDKGAQPLRRELGTIDVKTTEELVRYIIVLIVVMIGSVLIYRLFRNEG